MIMIMIGSGINSCSITGSHIMYVCSYVYWKVNLDANIITILIDAHACYNVYTCMHTCINTHVCLCMYVGMYVRTYVCMYVFVCFYVSSCVCNCICVYVYMFVFLLTVT